MGDRIMNVAILMSVYNRKAATLRCLDLCREQIRAMKKDGLYSFSIFLTEDGCTDGTSEAVSELFPEVEIIHGDGTLFWNRGMCAAWNAAAKEHQDFYLWINDDTMIQPGAFEVLLSNSAALGHKAIVVGTAAGSDGRLSYGGRSKAGKIIAPDETIPEACDIFNGNLVLVPDYVYKHLGTLDMVYSHSYGDFDYGIRAMKKGLTAVVAPGVLAFCNRNTGIDKWRDPSVSLKERYAALSGPKGRPFKEQFVYDTRRSGALFALLHYISILIKMLFPKAYR